jgi:hypothetical protein
MTYFKLFRIMKRNDPKPLKRKRGRPRLWVSEKERIKAFIRSKRLKLLQELGAYCHWPGCLETRAEHLTFDHINPVFKEFDSEKHNQATRMAEYARQAAAGNLQVLCGKHNSMKKDREMEQLDLIESPF